MNASKKTVKQVIKEAAAGKQKKVQPATANSFFDKTRQANKGKKSAKLRDIIAEAAKGKKHQTHSTDKFEANKQVIKKLRDSLTELQASYGDLNELFNNTVAAQDSTVASLLQDLRYTVSRLDKADFSLKYDVSSGSLFVDGEDSIAVSTPDVLAMLSSLTSLFPDKSISLSIDGDADYTDGAALDKLTELNGAPAPSIAAVPPVSPQEDTDIDAVLGGLGDGKIKDNLDPDLRFVCTYKDDTYSIWDKQLGILVKVVTTPKEADAMLQGLVAGVTSQDTPPADDNIETPPQEGGDGDVFADGDEVLDSTRVTDCALGVDSGWADCANFDVDYMTNAGWSSEKIKSFIEGISEGKYIPFFAQLPAFSEFNNDDTMFDLSVGAGLDFVNNNFASTQEANAMLEEAQGLDAMSSFMTAYSNLIYAAFNLSQQEGVSRLMHEMGITEEQAQGLVKTYAVKTKAEIDKELEDIFKGDFTKMRNFYNFKSDDDFKESLAQKK